MPDWGYRSQKIQKQATYLRSAAEQTIHHLRNGQDMTRDQVSAILQAILEFTALTSGEPSPKDILEGESEMD